MSITNIGGGKGKGEIGEVILMPDEFENTTEASKYIKLDTAKFLTKTEAPKLWELLSFAGTYYISDTASTTTSRNIIKLNEYIYARCIDSTDLQFSDNLQFNNYVSFTDISDYSGIKYFLGINSVGNFVVGGNSDRNILFNYNVNSTDLTSFLNSITFTDFTTSNSEYGVVVGLTNSYIIVSLAVNSVNAYFTEISNFGNDSFTQISRLYTDTINECDFLINDYFVERGSIVNLSTLNRTTLYISDYGAINHVHFYKNGKSYLSYSPQKTYMIESNNVFTELDIADEDSTNFYIFDYIDDDNLITGDYYRLKYKYENSVKNDIDTLLLDTKVSSTGGATKYAYDTASSITRFGTSFLSYDNTNNIVYEIDYSSEKPESFQIDAVVSEHTGYSYFMKIE